MFEADQWSLARYPANQHNLPVKQTGVAMFIFNDRASRALAFAIVSAAALLLSGRTDGAGAETISGNCTTNTTAFRQNDETFSTSSQSSVNVTGMRIEFVQAVTGCVVVQFSAYALTEPGNSSYVTFDLDDNSPGKTVLFGDRVPVGRTDILTVVHVFRGVTAGTHTVRMKLLSFNGGQVSANGPKTLLVNYRK